MWSVTHHMQFKSGKWQVKGSYWTIEKELNKVKGVFENHFSVFGGKNKTKLTAAQPGAPPHSFFSTDREMALLLFLKLSSKVPAVTTGFSGPFHHLL